MRKDEAMYATATLELHQTVVVAPESELCERMEEFLWEVSAGWPQVMTFLESCDLDREACRMLQELRRNDWDC
jgi:hypothetical protein